FQDASATTDEAAGCLTLDAFGPAFLAALEQAVAAAQCPQCPASAPAPRFNPIPMLLPLGGSVKIGVEIGVAPRLAISQRGVAIEVRARFTPKPQGDDACDPHWLAQARHLFLIAEQCQKSGDLDMARNCYQEVQLLAPQSSYAKKAAEQVLELTCHDDARVRVANALRSLAHDHWTLEAVKAIALYSNDAEEQETQSPGEEWWQERFLKAAREIHEERLRNDQNSPKEAAEQAQALTCAGSSEYEVPPSP